jgi:hypothetical protein
LDTGTITETVQFQIDGVNLGQPASLNNGNFSFTTSTLTAGPHTITAIHSGHINFL